MKLIHLTAKRYPSSTADHLYVKSLAKAFSDILKNDYTFVVSKSNPHELAGINVVETVAPTRFRSIYYFFWILLFILRNRYTNRNSVFFSNDPHLLFFLIFWKKATFCSYMICSDWHMLFNDWRDKTISRGSDFLITTSKKLKSALVRMSCISPEKIYTAYGGVSLREFDSAKTHSDLRGTLGLPKGEILVGYVGFFKTLGMDKGIGTMITSLKYLDENIHMVFVGGKDEEITEYSTAAESMGVEGRCMFIGRQDSEKVPLYECAMDILVIPYPDRPHFRQYGLPMKIYEYLACKRPIIYSALELSEEILSDCAYTFIADDPINLANIIKQVKGKLGSDEVDRRIEIGYGKVFDMTWHKKAMNIIAFIEEGQP